MKYGKNSVLKIEFLLPGMPNIAAVVAAYNEEKTIGSVVQALKESGFFQNIVVISDGSTDKTKLAAQESGATIVHELPFRHGKAAAMKHGVTHTDAPILFFCDADLIGFNKEHIERILMPVTTGKMVMCVGIRDRGKLLMRISRRLPLIGGERAMLRHVFMGVPDRYLSGFMVEAALNYFCRSRKLPYGTASCPGLHIRRKMQKVGFWRGLFEYLGMTYQIIKAMLVVRVARMRGRF